MNIDNVIRQIENSPIWKDLNQKCKKMYEQHNRIPSEEEYQTVRNILICKTILEDSEVKEKMMRYIYKELKQS